MTHPQSSSPQNPSKATTFRCSSCSSARRWRAPPLACSMHSLLCVGTSFLNTLSDFRLIHASTPAETLRSTPCPPCSAIMLGPAFSQPEVVASFVGSSGLPVICLVEIPTPALAVRLLNAGARLVIDRDVHPAELRARLYALFRRRSLSSSPLRVAQLTLDVDRRVASCGHEILPLKHQEFKVLVCLAERPGKVRSRAMLSNAIGGRSAFRKSGTLDVHLSSLRGRLRQAGAEICSCKGVSGIQTGVIGPLRHQRVLQATSSQNPQPGWGSLTRLRPSCLAAYRAKSAARSR